LAEGVDDRDLRLLDQPGLDQLADDDVDLGRQIDGEGVATDHHDPVVEPVELDADLQRGGQQRVDLDGVDPGRAGRGGEEGEDARARAGVDHDIARADDLTDGPAEGQSPL